MLGPKPFVLHISYTESFIVFIIIEEVYQSIVHCLIPLQSCFKGILKCITDRQPDQQNRRYQISGRS